MTHEFAGAFQQAVRIRKFGALEESDVNMSSKRIYIAKCRFPRARRWMIVMQQLAHIGPTLAHYLEPVSGDRSQFYRAFIEPGVYGRISSNGVRKLKKRVSD